MKPSTWAALAAAFAAELVSSLVDKLKGEANDVAVDQAAKQIVRALMRIPLQIRQHAQTQIATALVGSAADLLGLSSATKQELTNAVGKRLLEATLTELAEVADAALEATKRWEKL